MRELITHFPLKKILHIVVKFVSDYHQSRDKAKMSDAIVVKTRKFKRNPLLSRRQVRRGLSMVYLMP